MSMKILVTGAKGFVGKNLCAELKNVMEGKSKCWGPELVVDEVYEYDLGNSQQELDEWCSQCDFVFNLAGVNRPKETSEFMEGNFGFASTLLDTLKKHKNTCPVMLSSSQQASLTGRFGNSEYGRSKKAGEELFFAYSEETGAKVMVYRFPNLFGRKIQYPFHMIINGIFPSIRISYGKVCKGKIPRLLNVFNDRRNKP